MNFQNSRYEYYFAKPEDSSQILEIFESVDFSGNISVLFTRRPDPYESLMLEGDTVLIPVVKDKENGKICGMGCCVIRKAFINGEIKNTGYLTGLKIRREYRTKLRMIMDVYRFLYENTKNHVDIYYTTILKDNKTVQSMLEKKRKNMPIYHYYGGYTVYCFTNKILQFPKRGQCYKGYRFEKGNIKGLEDFYRLYLKDYNFSPMDMKLFGLRAKDFFTLRDEHGEIIAACAVWNQQSYKQYIVTGYSGVFKYLSKLPLRWIGYPNFPKENIPVNYASIALFCLKDMDLKVAEYFMDQVSKSSTEYDFLMLGLFENNPLNEIFHKRKHIKYQSKLYIVSWEDSLYTLDDRPIDIEVGLL